MPPTDTLDILSEPKICAPTNEQERKYKDLLGKLRALYRRDQFEIHEKVVAFHDILKRKYPDAREYLMFHMVSGSTFHGFNGKFDFLTVDSVEHFIEREYKRAFTS